MRTIRNKPKEDGRKRGKSRTSDRLLTDVPELLPIGPGPARHWWLAALTVAAAAVIVYLPTLNNDFVNWDDFDYLTKNDYIAESGGLKRIWALPENDTLKRIFPNAHLEKHNQFYPMVFSTYWLEHKLTLWWNEEAAKESYQGVDHLERGFEPGVIHFTNMVLHALCTALIVWLLRLLGVSPWVAWLTAGLFAVHPINVASVAWAAERKNVLSGVFYLLALGFYIKDTRRRSWITYSVCMLLYVLALLSKSATMTLPATAVLCDRLIERRWRWQSLVRVAPMLALGAVSAFITKTTEVSNAGTTMVALDVALRPFAAAGAIWFYIGKVLIPCHFPGVYTRWDIRGSWVLFLAALAAIPAAGLLVYRLRKRIPEHAIWGMGHYLVSLSPMLGLLAFNYTQFSFVADHFVYIPVIGIFLGIALAVDALRKRAQAPLVRSIVPTALAGAVLIGLGTDSFLHCKKVWKDGQSFWEYTLKLNPDCWPGHYNLGNIYSRKMEALVRESKQLRQGAANEADPVAKDQALQGAKEKQSTAFELAYKAVDCYAEAGRTNPDLHQAYNARGRVLAYLGRWDEMVEAYEQAVALNGRRPLYRYKLAEGLVKLGRREEAATQWYEIVRNNVRGSSHDTYLVQSCLKLAEYMMDKGRPADAVSWYERALEVRPNSRTAQRGLAAARAADNSGQQSTGG